MKSKLPYFFLALITLIADQASKLWAMLWLKPVFTIEIIPGFFRFSYATNRGVAFSMFADSEINMRWVLSGVSVLAALFVGNYLMRSLPQQRRLNTALALLLAGIVGNLVDRVRVGEVVDFIEAHWRDQYAWPTFNIADSAICIGAVLLAIEMMRDAKPNRVPSTIAPSAPDDPGIRSSENVP